MKPAELSEWLSARAKHEWQTGGFHEAAPLLRAAKLVAVHDELLAALANLVADWERVHGPIPEDHEAKAALHAAKGGAK